jgi:hypothetical protein
VLVGSGRYAGLPQLISTTKIYVFPPRAPTFEAGFIIKPQLSHRDTQEAVGVADARTPGCAHEEWLRRHRFDDIHLKPRSTTVSTPC